MLTVEESPNKRTGWVTEYATYAYLCDVIVDEAHRGKGLAKWILSEALSRPDLSTMRRLSLVTQNAHGVYERLDLNRLIMLSDIWSFLGDNDKPFKLHPNA